ncbi:MAG: deoxyguanosinetriphosphate triphosphohydrolase [Verrucomicrobiota bacterium]|nr:deoxyguanosinetriphosphate triphosphohydrolase [Verrucomicrobiota bacterium]
MFQSRLQQEQLENNTLAAFAQKSGETRGRDFPEDKHDIRTDYQRDRARVIHSGAFRRLEYKTQVFLNGTGDHLRTRLTHTIEVANISRTIAKALRLNEDLTETIALAHDLGHSPFGHCGEDTLNELMTGYGGFDHNLQSLRIVEVIEKKYPNFDGLNLTWEVREGLVKHETSHDTPDDKNKKYFRFPRPSLEAQIANLADEIAYYSHDIEDGIEAGFLKIEALNDLDLWKDALAEVKNRYQIKDDSVRAGVVIRYLIDRAVYDVIRHSAKRITDAGVSSADDVRKHPENLIAYSAELSKLNLKLRKYLYQNLYFHKAVRSVHHDTCEMMRRLFGHFIAHPDLIGRKSAVRISKIGIYRAVCDYVSGMTDRYLIAQYTQYFGITKP